MFEKRVGANVVYQDANGYKYYNDTQGDLVTGSSINIPHDHHEIHDGKSFSIEYTRTTDATDAHRSGIYIKTPLTASGLCHALISFAASTAANLSICEGVTIAANVGTHANVVINRFRDSTGVSGIKDNATSPAANKFTTLSEAQIAADGTFDTGTIVRTEPIRVGDSPKPAGGTSRGSQEYILKANTAYVFLITNTTAAANIHYILVDWYELVHKTAV